MDYIKVAQSEIKSFDLRLHWDRLNEFPLIAAVVKNMQSGHIYLSSEDIPNAVFVCNKFGFSILSILNTDCFSYDSFSKLMNYNKSIPNYLMFYDVDGRTIDYFVKSPRNCQKVRDRKQFRYFNEDISLVNNILLKIPNKYRVVDMKQFNSTFYSHFKIDLDHRFWNSWDDFKKMGIGFVVIDDKEQALSLCYTACISNSIAEIDVATLDEYRGQGFATYASAMVIKSCIERGIFPNWDCFIDNKASVKLAIKFQFVLLKKYKFLSFSRS